MIRSSFCADGNCVTVTLRGGVVLVAHSDAPDRAIAYPVAQWAQRCESMRRHEGAAPYRLPSNVTKEVDGVTWHKGGITLRFTDAEWAAFADGVKAGQFDAEVLGG